MGSSRSRRLRREGDFHFVATTRQHFVHVLTKEKLDTLSALTRVARAPTWRGRTSPSRG